MPGLRRLSGTQPPRANSNPVMAFRLPRPYTAWIAVLVLQTGSCQRKHPEPPPPKNDSAKEKAGAPDVSQVLAIMERRARFYLIVDTDGVPTCQRWRFERSKIATWTAAGVPNFVQDLSPGNARFPVRLRVEQREGRIVVLDPRVVVPDGEKSGIGASLGSCTQKEEGTSCDGYVGPQSLTPASLDDGTIATKEGIRWYLDEKVCRAALSGHRKSDPTLCSPVVSRYPAGVEIAPLSEAFQRIFTSGGKLVRNGWSETDGKPICEPWSVRGSRGSRMELANVEHLKVGCSVYLFKRSVQIGLAGNAMMWAGPSGEVLRTIHQCREGGGIGAGTIGCGDYLPVSGRGRDKVVIGRDQTFYLDRSACERDLRQQGN
jgi:hypothetical protein